MSQRELAATLRLSPRQIRNLTDDGVLARDGSLRYDLGESIQRFVAYREEGARRKGSATKEELLTLQARKLETEIEANELSLARDRAQLVTLDYMELQNVGLLEALRARCLNAPGKWALSIGDALGVAPTIVLPIIEPLIADLLSELAEAGDDPELDAEDEDASGDAPNSESSVA